MTRRQLDIADMQCWIFRMAQSKWQMTPKECAELFKKYDILSFISESYELLHVSSYICFVSIIHIMEPDFNSNAQ